MLYNTFHFHYQFCKKKNDKGDASFLEKSIRNRSYIGMLLVKSPRVLKLSEGKYWGFVHVWKDLPNEIPAVERENSNYLCLHSIKKIS